MSPLNLTAEQHAEMWRLIGIYATALRVLSDAGYDQNSLAYRDFTAATVRLDRFMFGHPASLIPLGATL